MHVGMAVIFQATDPKRSDRDVYRAELKLGDLAEPLGFDSIWGVEHHFTDYTMCPDVLQYLTYFAGRTERRSSSARWSWCCPGTIRCAWPNRSPCSTTCRTAASSSAWAAGWDASSSTASASTRTARANVSSKSAQMLLEGLERGWCEFDGKIIKQARRDIRPRPFKSFKGRTYAAAVSPESSEIMAKLGIGLLIIPQKPWEAVTKELANYRRIYRR